METNSLFKEYKDVFKEEAPSPKTVKKEGGYAYSPFALQDAIGERNVKNAWIEYNRLVLDGIEPEDIIHKIVGKVRDLTAISLGATKADLSMKDYPYSKSKKDLKNWGTEDLKNLYTKLVSIYHSSRMHDGEPLEMALEKVLLCI
jgi:DNA polymerase III gamma/tau subunit